VSKPRSLAVIVRNRSTRLVVVCNISHGISIAVTTGVSYTLISPTVNGSFFSPKLYCRPITFRAFVVTQFPAYLNSAVHDAITKTVHNPHYRISIFDDSARMLRGPYTTAVVNIVILLSVSSFIVYLLLTVCYHSITLTDSCFIFSHILCNE
jgi:hypothetical protein